MTDLIEGMAKALCRANCCMDCECNTNGWKSFIDDAKAAFGFFADPNNITPEMVEAARETVHENQLINVHRDTVFKALTAALKAAMEE